LGARSNRWGANDFRNVPVVTQDGKTLKFHDEVIDGFGNASEVTMKISKIVFVAISAIGLGSSCAHAQTPSPSAQPVPSSTQTATATTATFTAVVAKVNRAAGTISLRQTLRAKPIQAHDLPAATADYQASPVLLNTATVGATVQATVERINGKPTVIALQ
jgi:Cu/Ag efflux protein CusF